MASLKEWKRDFLKKSKWDRVRLILEILGVIIALIGLFLGGKYLIKNVIIGDNNTQTNVEGDYLEVKGDNYGSIFFKSIINVTSNNFPSDCSGYYQPGFEELIITGQEYSLNGHEPIGTRHDLWIFPTGQEAFLKEIQFNKSYVVGLCNHEGTDCCIYGAFKKNNLDYICNIIKMESWDQKSMPKLMDPYKLNLTAKDCTIYYK